MNYSLNELESTMHKAIIGAGHSTGVAQDLSRAAGWLCTQGIDGAALLLDVLGQPAIKPSVSIGNDGNYEFKDVCILSSGPSIIDILVSESKSSSDGTKESQVHLSNIYAPGLLIALAANATQEFRVQIEILFSSGETIVLSQPTMGASQNLKDIELQTGVDAVLKCSVSEVSNTSVQGEETIDVEGKPISISESTIQLLNTFAAKTYVPATEASRIAGAGAGLTDND